MSSLFPLPCQRLTSHITYPFPPRVHSPYMITSRAHSFRAHFISPLFFFRRVFLPQNRPNNEKQLTSPHLSPSQHTHFFPLPLSPFIPGAAYHPFTPLVSSYWVVAAPTPTPPLGPLVNGCHNPPLQNYFAAFLFRPSARFVPSLILKFLCPQQPFSSTARAHLSFPAFFSPILLHKEGRNPFFKARLVAVPPPHCEDELSVPPTLLFLAIFSRMFHDVEKRRFSFLPGPTLFPNLFVVPSVSSKGSSSFPL